MTGPACGNNPNHRMSDGDRRVVEDFKAYLAVQAAVAKTLYGFTPLPEISWEEAPESDRARFRRRAAAVLAVLPATTDQTAAPSAVVRKTLRRWAYAAGHIESELDGAVDRMYELVTRDVLRRMADETQPAETPRPKRERIVYLSTPCVVCTHPFNWHVGGVCQFDDEVNRCGCIAFATGARQDGAQP
ncbi:hypothetical protein [Streptomyces sp. NPDC059402]|uniref:hypothetical protein n=1 Tax=Streptomyces sp. NPDC059402 TaxID=3346822 RepID=UPI00368D8E1C